MPIQHQINLTSQISGFNSQFKANMPIGIIGTATKGDQNKIIRIQSEGDLEQFGAPTATDTLVPEIRILQRYGCGNIYAIRVATGATDDETTQNIVGAENAGVKTGSKLFKDMFALYGDTLRWILVPKFTSVAMIAAIIEAATANDAFVALDFAAGTSTATAKTTRGTATGMGTKSVRLIPCIPKVMNGATVESLATHLVGVEAYIDASKGFGFSPSNVKLNKITGVETGFTVSYTDVNADNQQLERIGCISVNHNSDGYVIWGNRNGLYEATVNEGWDTYITLNRVKQELNILFVYTAMKFMDMPCNYSTAMLLESALNNVILDNSGKGNYSTTSKATLNQSKTDFTQRKLVYDILVKCNLPTEVIELNTVYTVAL